MTAADIRIVRTVSLPDVCGCCTGRDGVLLVHLGWRDGDARGGCMHQLCVACRRLLVEVLGEVTSAAKVELEASR